MASPNAEPTAIELAAQLLRQTASDPYQFVMRAFPWGEPGPLEDKLGPRSWQAEELIALGEHLRSPRRFDPFRDSIASGHGIGKSALMSFLMLWGITTCVDARGTVTANTEAQLRTKTWPELRKWYSLCAVRDFFRVENTVFRAADTEHALTWRMDALPWSENNPEAFAGLHNEGRRILMLMDEASAVHDKIWEVIEGALTDQNTEIILIVQGNPTRPTGRFFDTHNRLAHRWRHRKIDSRGVEGTNKAQLNQWVDDYGVDSDFVRVRVRGEFPKSATNQLIPLDVIERATQIDTSPQVTDPLVFGIDVARFGDDESVLYTRKGKVAGIYNFYTWRQHDMVQLADAIAPLITEYKPHYVNIDGGGIGGGLIDILRHRGFNVHEVLFGAVPRNEDFANKRAEMWCDMREWLRSGGCIPWNDQDLLEDLKNQTYSIKETRSNSLALTPKEVMKRDGLRSPDHGDALALTFAQVVSPISHPKHTLVFAGADAETEYVRGWR